MTINDVAVVVVVTLAGFIRGITGFGGAMLMAPSLSLIIGAVPTVVIALLLETAAALVMFSDALPRINKRVLFYLTLPACFTIPIGGYLLLTLDPLVARKLISAVVAVFSLILLLGLRYSGPHRPTTSLVLGSVVGVMLGATSVGAPPVILYLLSGPDPQAVTRANLTVFVTVISAVGLVMLLFAGAFTTGLMISASLLCIPYLAATWLGGALFARMSEIGVRRFALGFMFTMGVVGLLA
ncbi:MAG TPA: sulfite exporter TauE/SafE family protein [Pseudolabrys sp.]|nr:sulfite exporter TauE/SafE family protein [Pseudolabrys sp.]